MLTRIVTRKERKYNLIRPFWLVIMVAVFIWVSEMVFGKMVSSQIRFRREDILLYKQIILRNAMTNIGSNLLQKAKVL